ncbi:AAA family ATPase [Pseudomonas sp. BE134]|uniref:AAA family ATPase n=1 Tax=Pseudomonas sp. BE134 TaxID=2817843 RepID=UPI002854E0DF|nr:AAA family ATPase [Pseudomonas sp. BE134]MDR6926865.1 hypothetical protein [Pseudomonas sp. BE134]
MKGFQISSLTLSGASVPNAEVIFRTGLNVISGPSDTGKTFIVQCIDYLLGASKVPKSVPEASFYESAELCLIEIDTGEEVRISRSLKTAGKFKVVRSTETFYLAAKHKAGDSQTLSNFLLKMSGFIDKRVRVNKDGKVRELSFRDVARLIIVDEESIIKEISPALTGQYISATAESSVFRLLLTGVDASLIEGVEEQKLSPLKQLGKVELLSYLLEENNKKIDSLSLSIPAWEYAYEESKRVDVVYKDTELALQADNEISYFLEARRRDVLIEVYKVESRVDVLAELKNRFALLKQQYISDLARLQSIAEVSFRLDQMGEENCPVCGALSDHQAHDHERVGPSHEEITLSCKAEIRKINSLLSDLDDTRIDNESQIDEFSQELRMLKAELNFIGEELDGLIKPKIEAALNAFLHIQGERDLYNRALDLFARAHELEDMLLEIEGADNSTTEGMPSPKLGAGEVSEFISEVETLLAEWNFPNHGRVGFSEKEQDIVLIDRARSSHGKGVRAITHAAFSLSLLLHCIKKHLPHPGVVIIDSPLVVYREPDTDEVGFTHEVKDSFYRSLAKNFREQQVIVVENDEPPKDIEEFACLIKFTASSSGRGGFIPS